MFKCFLVSDVMKTVSNSICEPASMTGIRQRHWSILPRQLALPDLCTSGFCQPHYKTVDALAIILKDTLINVVNMTAHHKF